jgi:hypothetical protein
VASARTVEDYINGFEHPIIDKVHGEPTYATIHMVPKRLNANAASIHSYRGGGNHGHLGAIISPTRYAEIIPVPFIAPPNQGRTAQVPANAPAEAQAMLEQNYTANARKFQQYNTLQRALKQQIIKTFDPLWIQGIEDAIVAFANVKARQMMVYLYDSYRGITQNDFVDNNKKLSEPFDPAQPIETIFRTIKNAVYYADAGHAPFEVNQIIAQTYTHLFNSGVLLDACERWNVLPLAAKKWTTIKTHFTRAHKTYKLMKGTTTGAGYHATANAAANEFQQDTVEAISTLANAAAMDKGKFDTLMTTNANLEAKLAALTEQVRLVNTKNEAPPQIHTPSPAPYNPQGLRPVPWMTAGRGQGGRGRGRSARPDNGNYCWSHGYGVTDRHTSATCTYPYEGHQTGATRANTMGGVQQRPRSDRTLTSRASM